MINKEVHNPELKNEFSLITQVINNSIDQLFTQFEYALKLKIAEAGFTDIESLSIEEFCNNHDVVIRKYVDSDLVKLYVDDIKVTYWHDKMEITTGYNSFFATYNNKKQV